MQQTQWFAYDSMNRQILVDGALNGDANNQANLTADQGHILTYDKAGNRLTDTHFGRYVTLDKRTGISLLEAYSPVATAVRRAATISGGSAMLIFLAMAMGRSRR